MKTINKQSFSQGCSFKMWIGVEKLRTEVSTIFFLSCNHANAMYAVFQKLTVLYGNKNTCILNNVIQSLEHGLFYTTCFLRNWHSCRHPSCHQRLGSLWQKACNKPTAKLFLGSVALSLSRENSLSHVPKPCYRSCSFSQLLCLRHHAALKNAILQGTWSCSTHLMCGWCFVRQQSCWCTKQVLRLSMRRCNVQLYCWATSRRSQRLPFQDVWYSMLRHVVEIKACPIIVRNRA